MVLVVVALTFCLLIHKVYVYQTAEESKNITRGSAFEFLTYGTFFALLYTVIILNYYRLSTTYFIKIWKTFSIKSS